MGGPGSGRPPSKLSLEDARALDIGELCDGGAALALPAGQIIWRERGSGRILGLLAYRIARETPVALPARLLLLYLYWPGGVSAPQGDQVELLGSERVRHLALCPTPGCAQRVRRLYAPLGEHPCLCRSCHDLVYRSSAKERELRFARRILAPLLDEVRAACAGLGPLPAADEDGYRGAQQCRLDCLRLRSAGLSLRQIATRVGVSKSSVQRYLQAGPAGIDLLELYRERQLESDLGRYASLADGSLTPGAIARELREIDREAKRFGLYRHSPTENEERVLFRQPTQVADDEPQVTLADHGRCFDVLREEGQRRLSLELARREVALSRPASR
jgi:transcriptional regulator with XRE-family HTH domain